jgi:hypothetical protein
MRMATAASSQNDAFVPPWPISTRSIWPLLAAMTIAAQTDAAVDRHQEGVPDHHSSKIPPLLTRILGAARKETEKGYA